MRDDRRRPEGKKKGYDETNAFPVHSCSKSITSALVGIAIQQGYIGGMDDLFSDYLPQVAELEGGGEGADPPAPPHPHLWPGVAGVDRPHQLDGVPNRRKLGGLYTGAAAGGPARGGV